MDLTLKSFSLMLSYPSRELQQEVPAMREALRKDRRLDRKNFKGIETLLSTIEDSDIWNLQEEFVDLFDRSRSLSLNLFEHVHGESRDRGMAMVNLLETYRQAGFEPVASELPDHLPMLLEFLSMRPSKEATVLLADAAHLFEVLAERLGRRNSPYASVFRSLTSIAGKAANREVVKELLEQPDEDPEDLEALDRAWEEAEVTFGPDPGAGCAKTRDLLARIETARPGVSDQGSPVS